MQKKLLAIAVAGALAPAAAMAQSTVEIYGRANLGVDNWRATGSNVAGGNFASRARVFDSGSRLGFRVNESLGGGMRAFVVIETGAQLDSGSGNGQSGSPNASTGFWASRDSYLGIGGDWGDVRFGRQSPYYGNGIISQADSNYINKAVDGAFSFNGAITTPAGRTSNVVSYNSPTIGGFNASVYWSPLATEGSTYTGTGQSKDNLWSVTGRYTAGAIRLQADWVRRDNAATNFIVPATGKPQLKGWKVGGGFAYAPGSQVSVIFGQHENKAIQTAVTVGAFTVANAGDSPKVSIWIANWEHMLGQFQLIAQYAHWNKIKGLSNDPGSTDAAGYTFAGKYFLSKRTGVYASFSQIKNKDNSFYDMNNGGYSSSTGFAIGNRGDDPRVMAVGVMHNF
jgi:predicted porin